jgi:hypothetical protein
MTTPMMKTREVEDDLGGNTANGVRVYEVDVFEAGADVALVSSHELHGNVAAVVCSVQLLHLVEDGGVFDEGCVNPVEEVEIENGAEENQP